MSKIYPIYIMAIHVNPELKVIIFFLSYHFPTPNKSSARYTIISSAKL